MKIIIEFMYTGRINAVRRRFASLRVAVYNIRMRRLSDLLTRELQHFKSNLECRINEFNNYNMKRNVKMINGSNAEKNFNISDSQFIDVNAQEVRSESKSNKGNFNLFKLRFFKVGSYALLNKKLQNYVYNSSFVLIFFIV